MSVTLGNNYGFKANQFAKKEVKKVEEENKTEAQKVNPDDIKKGALGAVVNEEDIKKSDEIDNETLIANMGIEINKNDKIGGVQPKTITHEKWGAADGTSIDITIVDNEPDGDGGTTSGAVVTYKDKDGNSTGTQVFLAEEYKFMLSILKLKYATQL